VRSHIQILARAVRDRAFAIGGCDLTLVIDWEIESDRSFKLIIAELPVLPLLQTDLELLLSVQHLAPASPVVEQIQL
jgi:hypothetical protein